MKSRVKVPRLALIEAIEAELAKAAQQHEKDVAAYEKVLENARPVIARALRSRADSIEDGGDFTVSYGNASVEVKVRVKGAADIYRKPSRTSVLLDAERSLKALRLSQDEFITIGAEDFGRYLA